MPSIETKLKQIKYGDKEKPLFSPNNRKEVKEEYKNNDGRRLGYSISADKTFNIGKYDVLGQSVTVKYHVAVQNGKPINEIIISSNLGTTKIGNTGVSLSGGWSRTITIFKFAFPAFPLITLNAKAQVQFHGVLAHLVQVNLLNLVLH